VTPVPAAGELAGARARQLLERYGIVTREGVRAEGIPGGFAGVYGALRSLEELGHARRGYFVAGQGAAQFALPGAVERLRADREIESPVRGDDALVLAATDPAQPYGAALPWPDTDARPARAAGASVVLRAGSAVAYIERGAKHLLTFGADAIADPSWVDAVARLVKQGRLAKLELQRVDGGPARESPLAEPLRAAGFVDGYRGLVLRG
ncbi:MAG TPA: DEAD/DEAH box helicase, partial [Acidimicrobiia bacterium]|nr:DEAD/DEAH box helicase [Acidimicrobiia bacterium]